MKKFRFLILLIILPLFIISCSKDENGDIIRDLTKNVFYIGNNEYLLANGHFIYVWKRWYPYEVLISLYSSGFDIIDGLNLTGTGDVFNITINAADTSGVLNQGTYSTDFDEEEEWFLDEIECYININSETMEASHGYIMTSGTMLLEKEGNEYEITINGLGGEYTLDSGELIESGIEMVAHYKGTLPELFCEWCD